MAAPRKRCCSSSSKHTKASPPTRRLLATTTRPAATEAALHAEKACEHGKARLNASLQRIEAYYHLGRFEEGLVVLDEDQMAPRAQIAAALLEGAILRAAGTICRRRRSLRECNDLVENPAYMAAFAEFLAARERWPEAAEWVDRALLRESQRKDSLALAHRDSKSRSAGSPCRCLRTLPPLTPPGMPRGGQPR